MNHAAFKTIAPFLIFFIGIFCLSSPSMGTDEKDVPSQSKNLQLIGPRYTPFEMERYPLAGLDLGSPRETLKAFLVNMNWAYSASTKDGTRSRKAMAFVEKASKCLNLSEIPPTMVRAVRIESAFLLIEILNRIDLPPFGTIPNKATMKAQGWSRWTIPHTEITLSRVSKGVHEGEYLFSPETVSRLEAYYKRSQHLPYKPDTWKNPYKSYIYAPGEMIPHQWIDQLPKWTKKSYFGQTLWQWIGLSISLLLAALVVWVVYRIEYRRRNKKGEVTSPWRFGKLLFPASGMLLAWIVEEFIDQQLNITGTPLTVTNFSLRLFFFIFSAVAILILGNILVNGITSSPRLQKRSIDSNLVRLSLRVLTLVMLFVLFWYAANYFGLSVTAVFASAGIMGLAIAMAARETLANFFGGISLLLDKPFTTGNYIILDSGERGEVVDIGLRSTRILTRDEILICIPNSVITNVKIVNESAPAPRFRVRIKIGVAYGSDIEQVERILMTLANENELAIKDPAPRVRFRAFGDSSLDFELLCWARRPEEKGRLIHSLNIQIYNALNEEGIEIPFPQRDVHLFNSSKDVPDGAGAEEKPKAGHGQPVG